MPRVARRSRLLWVGLPVFTVFAVFAVIVLLAYQENARVPEGEPPLVRAMAGPYKLAPDDPGGRQVAEQGAINDLLRDEPGPARPERVLPLPEEPRAPVIGVASPGDEALPATVGDAGQTPSTTADAAPGAALPGQGAGASGEADATREAEAALARLLADVGPNASTAEQPKAMPETPPPAADTTARAAAAPPPAPPADVRREPAEVATSVDAPSPEADKALTRLLAEIAGLPPDSTPETESAPARAPAAAVPAMAPAQSGDAQPAVGRGFRVQLAAVRGEEDAHRAWASLVDKLGPLIAEHRPLYQRAETVNGVFYRVQIGPFASEQAADRLCLEVQRRKASCFVVAP